MTYREILQLYKTGELEESKRKEVEADIEKQDAISEYLYEEAEIPGMEDLAADVPSEKETDKNEDSAEFAAMIQQSIRKAFIKMGVIVGTAVLAIVLCTIFVLPRVVSLFYYNPCEIVAKNEEYNVTMNRMSLDMAVYSELFMPGYYRDRVIAEPEGYGKYAISIPQEVSYTDRHTTVNGKLVRGKLSLYDTNILTRPTGNAFILPKESWFEGLPDAAMRSIAPGGSEEEAYEKIQGFNENDWYVGYVSLKNVMDYEEFNQWFSEKELHCNGLWCGIYVDEYRDYSPYEIMGFYPYYGYSGEGWEFEDYPNLRLGDSWLERDNTELMQEHFTSMLAYLRDHDEIMDIMGANSWMYDEMIQYVEENGLQLYGFAIGAKKDALLELFKDEKVSYIYTTPHN